MGKAMDNVDYVEDFAARIVRKAGDRVAANYEGHDLRAIAALRESVDQAVETAVVGMKLAGLSWQVIGDELGVTRQTVHKQYGGAVAAAQAKADQS